MSLASSVTTPDRHTTDFSFNRWRGDGIADLPTDADPSIAPLDPSNAEVLTVSTRGYAMINAGSCRMLALVAGGTSLAIEPWVYDEKLALWFKMLAAVTANANSIANIVTVGGMVGARVYPRITTNTGNVKRVGYVFA